MKKILEETKKEIQDIGKKVSWIGSECGTFAMSEKEFFELNEVLYDDGFGGQEIAKDLVVVFEDGSWLKRCEYDGSEWWEYECVPTKIKKPNKFIKIYGNDNNWASLFVLNSDSQ